MNYIVLDLEWNQPFSPKSKKRRTTGLDAEIIQIGAIKLNQDQKVQSEIKLTIRPKIYTVLHHQVRRLTGLSKEDLALGFTFPDALELFSQWCGKNFVFLTWGNSDMPVFRSNMRFYNLNNGWFPPTYNLQVFFAHQIAKSKDQWSLKRALEHLNIETEGTQHDALYDARNTVKVVTSLDLKKGIAEYDYDFFADGFSGKLSTADFTGFYSKRALFKHEDIRYFECPFCGALLSYEGWIPQNYTTFLSLATCEDHGDILRKLKLTRSKRNRYDAALTRYQACDHGKEVYRKKKEKQDRKRDYRRG